MTEDQLAAERAALANDIKAAIAELSDGREFPDLIAAVDQLAALAQREPVAEGEVAQAAKYIREHGVSGLGRYDRNQIADLLERTEAARTAAEDLVRQLEQWADSDKPLPEDDAILAAHPLQSGRHDCHAEAMRLVGAKRSKFALVALVNWRLAQLAAERERSAKLIEALKYISEYWNRDRNDMAMHNACWQAIEISEQAIVSYQSSQEDGHD